MTPICVGVVIPCYNCEQYIGRAIQSVLAQDYPYIDIVVVDDGSTDGSFAAAQAFGESVTCMTTGGNRGGNIARNLGMEALNTKYIQFLDADDELFPGKLSRQVAMLEQAPAKDVIFGSFEIVRVNDGHETSLGTFGPRHDAHPEIDWLEFRLAQTGTMFWRRSVLQSIGGWSTQLPELQDTELALRALTTGLNILIDRTPQSLWRRWNSQSVTTKTPRRRRRLMLGLLSRFGKWLDRRDLSSTEVRNKFETVLTNQLLETATSDFLYTSHYYREARTKGWIRHTLPLLRARRRQAWMAFSVRSKGLAKRILALPR